MVGSARDAGPRSDLCPLAHLRKRPDETGCSPHRVVPGLQPPRSNPIPRTSLDDTVTRRALSIGARGLPVRAAIATRSIWCSPGQGDAAIGINAADLAIAFSAGPSALIDRVASTGVGR